MFQELSCSYQESSIKNFVKVLAHFDRMYRRFGLPLFECKYFLFSSIRGVRIFEKFEFEFENIQRIRILEIGLKFVESNSNSNFTSATNSNRILREGEYSRILANIDYDDRSIWESQSVCHDNIIVQTYFHFCDTCNLRRS
jgi:hypothetical protein